MPPVDPDYLQVPGYVFRFEQCVRGERLFESWIAQRDGERYDIRTSDTSRTCQRQDHVKEPVLQSCMSCIGCIGGISVGVVEFVAEYNDNGYLLVYNPSDEQRHRPEPGVFAEYTRNGGYAKRMSRARGEQGATAAAAASRSNKTCAGSSARRSPGPMLDHPVRLRA